MATLVRPRQGKIIAGVCAGLAMRFGISVTLIRVAFVVFAVTGIGELVYLILWVVMPRRPSSAAYVEPREGLEPSTFRLPVGPKPFNWTQLGPSWLLRCGTHSSRAVPCAWS
jgi:phage shock protein C